MSDILCNWRKLEPKPSNRYSNCKENTAKFWNQSHKITLGDVPEPEPFSQTSFCVHSNGNYAEGNNKYRQ
jgi:hypothetical protein